VAEFRFPIYQDAAEQHRVLDVSCWAKEPRQDDLLGQAKVDITDTLKKGEFDGAFLTGLIFPALDEAFLRLG
jgi:hypothetical protein